MTTLPYWSDTASLPRFGALRENLDVDVLVIGGGLTGITAAYLLQRAGVTTALIERHRLAAIDTGHTTAHLTYVTDERLSDLVDTFGRNHAQAAWDAGLAALHSIFENVEREGIACDFAWVPGFLHVPVGARKGEEGDSLREDARLARELGFEAEFLDKVPFLEHPGIRFANQAIFHPRKYLAGLLKVITAGGVRVFEHTSAEEIQDEPLRIRANGHSIRCRHVVIATHVPLQGLTGTLSAMLFQTKLAPYTSYAIGATIPKAAVPEALFWDTSDPYFYLRIQRRRGHDYAILGGADHKTGQARDAERHFARVEKMLHRLIPGAVVAHRWSGQVIETHDGLPFIGETAPHQFVASGFAGNGMTFGTLGAMMACDAITGRANPWRDLFDVHRKKLRAAWDYLKENKDYPYYYVKDRLCRGDRNLRDLPKGEGRVVHRKGHLLSAYRDESGKLTVKSAVCPHLGCLVRWNSSEKTWDCPCHGSRFQATGEVLAGPAESGLADSSAA